MQMIIIDTVKEEDQRYNTVGDWYYDSTGTLHIKVSKMSNSFSELCVAVHEIVEVFLCQKDGVTQGQVDEFDFSHQHLAEPGDSPEAPYHLQHEKALIIERLLANFLNLDWQEHENNINEAG